MALRVVIPEQKARIQGVSSSVGHKQHNIHRHTRSNSLPNFHKGDTPYYDGHSIPLDEQAMLACLLADRQKVLISASPVAMSPMDRPPYPPHHYFTSSPSHSQSSLNSSPVSFFPPSIPVSPVRQHRPHHTKSNSYPIYAPIPLTDPITIPARQMPGYMYSSAYACASPYAMSYAATSTPMVHELESHPVPRAINKRYLKEKPLPKEPGTGKFVTKRMRKKMLSWCLQALKGAPQRKYTL